MFGGIILLLISPLLLAAMSLVASPAQAQSFGPMVNVSNTKSNSSTPDMAVSSPNVYVVWVDDKGAGQPLFSRSTDSGQTFSPGAQVFSGSSTVAPHVAAGGTNVYMVRSARASSRSPSQVYFRRSTNSGGAFEPQIQVSAATVDGAFLDAMAISGGNVYIVWHQWVGNWALFFARSTNSGANFGTPVNLSGSSGDAGDADLVADGSGVHVAWSENSQIYYRRSTNEGASFDGVINVSNNGDVNVFPALAVSGSSVYLAWREHAGGETTPHIFFARSDDTGVSFLPVGGVDLSGPTSDTRGVAGGPQLAASGSDVHVIWHANPGGGNYDVFYRGSIGGAPFGTPRDISCDDSSCASALNSPTGVIATNGANVYISWSGGPSTAREIYMAHSGDSGATFGATNINVSSTTLADSGGPWLVATPAGVHMIWLDRMPGNWDVFYRRGNP